MTETQPRDVDLRLVSRRFARGRIACEVDDRAVGDADRDSVIFT